MDLASCLQLFADEPPAYTLENANIVAAILLGSTGLIVGAGIVLWIRGRRR